MDSHLLALSDTREHHISTNQSQFLLGIISTYRYVWHALAISYKQCKPYQGQSLPKMMVGPVNGPMHQPTYESAKFCNSVFEPRSDRRDLLALKVKREKFTEKERPSPL